MALASTVAGADREMASREASRGPARNSAVVLEAELGHQQQMLARIVRGEPLEQTLNAICRHIERRYPGTHCSVLLLDRALGLLRHAASPTLPRSFVRQLDGLPVGEGMGACGTAAARGMPVIVSDLYTDPLTESFADLAQRFELGSVWSSPLRRAGGEVLGALAVYRAKPHTPTRAELKFVAAAGNLAALAIDRDRSDRALQAASNFDALTGLPNRTRFLELAGAKLSAPGHRVTLALVQLDRFQEINRSIGHVAGDGLLLEATARLRDVAGEHALVGRFSGDTFALLVPELDARGVGELTERIGAAMSEPLHADGVELLLTVSIGVASSARATDAFGLAREAEAAIEAARAGGPGHRQVYDRKLRAQQVARLRTESQLRRAIERGELVMHYQPILNVEQRRWSGVEALVRWQHPERGLLGPDDFIPLAEQTGLIVPLGLSVLEMACAQARAWANTLPGIGVAVNASPVQLSYPTTATEIKAIVERARLEPSTLTLEVTESTVMGQLDTARTVIEELKTAGVQVLVDDFGTGYSSLSRLGELPISGLKIDRRFARGLGHDPAVMPVVRAIADLARAYGLEVVVEGIEDAVALASVEALRCEYAQGYHLGRPAPAEVIEQLLAMPLPPASGSA